jgi:hypothetical protein
MAIEIPLSNGSVFQMNKPLANLSERALDHERKVLDRSDNDAGLEDIIPQNQSEKIGTLSFPVRKNNQPVRENTRRIEEIIRRRQPALLLCAGWSVPSIQELASIVDATKRVHTEVVLEAGEHGSSPISFRIRGGKKFRMGKQFFGCIGEHFAEEIRSLDEAMPIRAFTFMHRQALLLVCGEVMIVENHDGTGRFRNLVPKTVRDAVTHSAIILNPTHTRMGRPANLNAWRKFLSKNSRIYISASNWELSRQHRSPTLHTLWYDGKKQDVLQTFENDLLCYREWHLPKQ